MIVDLRASGLAALKNAGGQKFPTGMDVYTHGKWIVEGETVW